MKRSIDGLISGIIGLVVGEGVNGGEAGPGDAFLHALDEFSAGATMAQRKNAQALFRQLSGAICNVEHDIASNGERAVIERVLADGDVAFDVGANKGAWARAALTAAPGAKVHCFELIPETAKVLAESLRGLANVQVNACGLAEAPGECEAFFVRERTELSGLYLLHRNHTPERVKCRLTTGDLYAQRMKIDRVRFLKIDCEGYDYNVLEGCRDLLRHKRVDVVQFEYGYANIPARRLLADFYERLVGLGYAVGKLYPDGVDFKPYEAVDENFLGPNYVACLASDSDLMQRLRAF